MRIDYKKELESAARSMILVHEPGALLKIIVRMIVQKVQVTHACILLHERKKDSYLLRVSRGVPGYRVPHNFVRVDASNALIRLFRERLNAQFLHQGALVRDRALEILGRRGCDEQTAELMREALRQMEIFSANASIPCFFRDELLGMVFLGAKKDKSVFDLDELNFLVALSYDVAMGIRNAQLFKELQDELDKKKRLFLNTTLALTAAIEAKDHYTHGHTTRVTDLSLTLGYEFFRHSRQPFSAEFFENLQIASLLHDIGKIGIPEAILNKEGPLTDEERRRMQEHPLVGVDIIESIHELKDCIPGVKYHHERYDGRGYPQGLRDGEIPLMAAIIAVADAFDAMITDRPYRKGLSREQTITEIERESGFQFDPAVAQVLIRLFRENRI